MIRIRSLLLPACVRSPLVAAILISLCQSSQGANAADVDNGQEDKLGMVSMSNVKSIGIAIRKYAADHRSAFPSSLEELYPEYVPSLKSFENPVKPSEIRGKEEITQKTGYEYIVGRGVFSSSDIIVLYEKYESYPGGKYVLFGDGHVEWKAREELSILLARQTSFVLAAVISSGPMAMFKNLETRKTYAIQKGKAFGDYIVADITDRSVMIQRKSDSKRCEVKIGELLRFGR
jgi:prepilin-type processing-associated H-X9-DG protein